MAGFGRIPGRPQPAIPEAPADNEAWGRENAGWVRVVAVAGDTMTGPLTLAADPVAPLQAATKDYVDTTQALCVLKAGDTMTGPLVLPAIDPALDDEATRKLYVDTADADLQSQIDVLAAGLVYVGAYDVVADQVTWTPFSGLTDGPLPPANAPGIEAGWYVICTTSGTGTGNAPPVVLQGGDQLISGGPAGGAAWNVLHVGGASTTADQVALNPAVPPWVNVQQAVEALLPFSGAKPMTGNLTFANDGQGIITAGAGRFYKVAGAGMMIRESSGGQQPQIENNDGTNRRDIIDTQNGDARYLTPAAANARYVEQAGDTMTGGLGFGSVAVTTPTDLSRHIALWGTTFGFSITSGRLNYVVPSNNTHIFLSGGAERFYIASTVTSAAPFNMQNMPLSSSSAGETGDTQGYRFRTSSGRDVGNIYTNTNNPGLGPETRMRFQTNNGGYGYQDAFETQIGGPPTLYCYGPVSASNVINRSDLALKQDVSEPGAQEFAQAFAALQPKKFRRKPPPRGEGQTLPDQPGRWEYGFVAQDVERGAPSAIVTDRDGIKGYSLTDVLAIAVAKIRELEGQVAALRSRGTR